MEKPLLSENKISILADARGVDAAYWANIQHFVSKTKLDIELLFLVSAAFTNKGIEEFEQKQKVKIQVFEPTQTLNQNFASMASLASGGITLVLYETPKNFGSLVQLVQTYKKNIHKETLYVASAMQKGKSNSPFLNRISNSLMRVFTPVQYSDNNAQILLGKTNDISAWLNHELVTADTYHQSLNLARGYKLKTSEFAVAAEEIKKLSIVSVLKNIFSLRFHFFIKDAWWHFKNKENNWQDGNHPMYRFTFFAVFLVSFFAMPILSQDYGSTWDEKAHNEYSQLAYNYLSSFGSDTAALAESTSSADYIRQAYRFYGEQMNTIAAITYNWFGTGIYETRHFINSIYGLIGLIFTALLAFELAGWRAALLGILFMQFNPGWLGHSMNNPTDIPFATGFAFAGYFIVKVMRSLPKPKFRDLFWLAFGIGIGIASRVGAFLLVAYFGLFLAVYALDKLRRKEAKFGDMFFPFLKIFLMVATMGYLLGISLWPYALNNPLKHPFQAYIKAAENAFYTNNVELFEGQRMYMITDAPWYYVFKFLGIGNPLYLIIGVIASIILVLGLSKKIGIGNWAMLTFMLFFPILYAEYSNINYYNGWRHYLFILPFAVVLAALTFDYLLGQKKIIALGIALFLSVLFVKPAIWIVQNHPNQYVYFNELVGGLAGAYGNYETDYYSNSCREAAEWIAKQHPNDSLLVGINNETTTAAYWAHQINPRLQFVWTRETEEQKQKWDYLILTTRTYSKNELQNGSFPPKGTVYTVTADGIPLAAVIKRENYYMPLGYNSLDKSQFDSSVFYFREAVKYAPKDEEAWRMLGFSLLNLAKMDSSEITLKKAIEIYPENFTAYSNLGLVYFNQKEFAKATEAFGKSTKYKENVTESWYYSALAYLNLNDYGNAIKQLEMAKKHNASIPEVYYYLAKAYNLTGNLQKASDNYQIALGMNQNMREAWGELAEVFSKLNQPEYAKQCMDKYRALGGN